MIRIGPPRRHGFTLIEVLVAFVLLAFVLTAGITLFSWQKKRLLHQTLWRHAMEAMEQEVETHRGIPASFLEIGDDQRFLTMPEMDPEAMPVGMRWLPDPDARRDVSATMGDERLLTVILTLTWGEPGRRITYQEVFLVAR